MIQYDEIIQLSFFEATKDVCLSGYGEIDSNPEDCDPGSIIHHIRPGSYHVFKTSIKNDNKNSNSKHSLFLFHCDIFDEPTHFYDYKWIDGGGFDMDNEPVIIFNQHSSFNMTDLSQRLGNNMVDVLDNVVCFTMWCADYGYTYEVLQQEGQIVGIKVEELGIPKI